MTDSLIVFRMSTKVWMLLGLDDSGLVASMCPTLKVRGHSAPGTWWYEASEADARIILDDMRERSLDGPGGFEHLPADRRSLRRAAEHLAGVLGVARPNAKTAAYPPPARFCAHMEKLDAASVPPLPRSAQE